MRRNDFVVGGFWFVVRKILAALLGDDRGFVVRAGKRANRFIRVHEQDRDELHFVSQLSPQQIAALVPLHFGDPRQQFGFPQGLIGVGIFRLGATVPDSSDHRSSLRRKYRMDGLVEASATGDMVSPCLRPISVVC